MEALREVQGYRLEKVARNYAGSFAITKDGKKSEHQYNSDTKRHLLKLTDAEFLRYAKQVTLI